MTLTRIHNDIGKVKQTEKVRIKSLVNSLGDEGKKFTCKPPKYKNFGLRSQAKI